MRYRHQEALTKSVMLGHASQTCAAPSGAALNFYGGINADVHSVHLKGRPWWGTALDPDQLSLCYSTFMDVHDKRLQSMQKQLQEHDEGGMSLVYLDGAGFLSEGKEIKVTGTVEQKRLRDAVFGSQEDTFENHPGSLLNLFRKQGMRALSILRGIESSQEGVVPLAPRHHGRGSTFREALVSRAMNRAWDTSILGPVSTNETQQLAGTVRKFFEDHDLSSVLDGSNEQEDRFRQRLLTALNYQAARRERVAALATTRSSFRKTGTHWPGSASAVEKGELPSRRTWYDNGRLWEIEELLPHDNAQRKNENSAEIAEIHSAWRADNQRAADGALHPSSRELIHAWCSSIANQLAQSRLRTVAWNWESIALWYYYHLVGGFKMLDGEHG
ncbi:unnamed protein product [Amoebophrya sp. A120]|nr:unnamed protein product [Amoebophrya sp. A120]|eukprot:GSA120T00017339001.1